MDIQQLVLDFKKYGKNDGLPKNSFTTQQWEILGENLDITYGVALVHKEEDSKVYFFYKALAEKASRSLYEYLKAFQQDQNKNIGLPKSRLTEQEWNFLSKNLEEVYNVKFVGQGDYMLFQKSKRDAFQIAISRLKQRIKAKYPNIQDQAIDDIVLNNDVDSSSIYDKLKYMQNEYERPTLEEYNKGLEYFLASASKDVIQNPKAYNWKRTEYEKNLIMANKVGFVHDNPNWDWLTENIKTFGYQDWTWSRSYKHRKPAGEDAFHVSLNVSINADLLYNLDRLLIQDAGRHIVYYKFPKASDFNLDVKHRHDPVTIYLHDADKDTLNKIIAISKPHVRSNDGLIGTVLSTGVSIAKEPGKAVRVSVGQIAANEISNMMKEFIQNNK